MSEASTKASENGHSKCPEYKGIKLPVGERNAEFIRNIDKISLNKDTDILVAGYGRSGTTLTCQLVSLLTTDPDKLQDVHQSYIYKRICFMDMVYGGNLTITHGPSRYDEFCGSAPPRLAKTHLAYQLVSHWIERDSVKTVLAIRNPKDALVSYYHYHQVNPLLGFNPSTWDEFFEYIMSDQLVYGDLVTFLCDWWERRRNHNVLVVKYEDLVTNRRGQIRRVASFLGSKLNEDQLDKVWELTAFEEMQKNPGTSYKEIFSDQFIRKGKIGQWKKYFTVQQNELFNEKYKLVLAKAGLDFMYQ